MLQEHEGRTWKFQDLERDYKTRLTFGYYRPQDLGELGASMIPMRPSHMLPRVSCP